MDDIKKNIDTIKQQNFLFNEYCSYIKSKNPLMPQCDKTFLTEINKVIDLTDDNIYNYLKNFIITNNQLKVIINDKCANTSNLCKTYNEYKNIIDNIITDILKLILKDNYDGIIFNDFFSIFSNINVIDNNNNNRQNANDSKINNIVIEKISNIIENMENNKEDASYKSKLIEIINYIYSDILLSTGTSTYDTYKKDIEKFIINNFLKDEYKPKTEGGKRKQKTRKTRKTHKNKKPKNTKRKHTKKYKN